MFFINKKHLLGIQNEIVTAKLDAIKFAKIKDENKEPDAPHS